MTPDHTGRIAIIGGSTNGLGKAIALELAAHNAQIILLSHKEEKLKELCQQLPRPIQQKHHYLCVDFLDFKTTSTKLKEYLNDKKIDILVNNTPGPALGTINEQTMDTYQQSFDLLFKNIVHLTQLVLPNMKNQKWGKIITISSITVREPLNHLVLSNTMRLAVQGWLKSLANELAQFNINVNSILTGYFYTERLNDIISLQAKNKNIDLEQLKEEVFYSQIPMKRFGKPEEYAYLVNFLCSNYANYITGTSIPIDGGLLKNI